MSKAPPLAPTDEVLRDIEQKHAHGVVVVAFLGQTQAQSQAQGSSEQEGEKQAAAEAAQDAAQALQHTALFADAAAGNDHVFVRATSAESAARHSVVSPALLVLNG